MGMPEDYAEIVLTCEGDYYDPAFHIQLDNFRHQFEELILSDADKVVLTKVEPWNSVRVTLNIPRHAVGKLKELARCQNDVLRSLGILSVQIEGDQAIMLTIAGKNQEPTQLVFRVPYREDGQNSSLSATSTDSVNLTALHEFTQIFNSHGNISEDLLKLTAEHACLMPAPSSTVVRKKHSSAARTSSALQNGSQSIQQQESFHISAAAIVNAQRTMVPTDISSCSPLLVNLLQTDMNNAHCRPWTASDMQPPSESLSVNLAKPKRKPPRRKKKTEAESKNTPLSDSNVPQIPDNNTSVWPVPPIYNDNLVKTGVTSTNQTPLNRLPLLNTSNNADCKIDDTSKSDSQIQLSQMDPTNVTTSTTDDLFQQNKNLVITSSMLSSGSQIESIVSNNSTSHVMGSGTTTVQVNNGINAPLSMFPPGLMMMPVGGSTPALAAMGSHNFLNAISLLPAAQFLNLAALTAQVSVQENLLSSNNTSSISTSATSVSTSDNITNTQVPDVPLLATTPFSLLSQMMNQHIPALLVSQVPNSQTGATNTSIIPVSVALGTPSLSVPIPAASIPVATSGSVASSAPLLFNPAAVATFLNMASLFGSPSLPLPINASFVPRFSGPSCSLTDTVVTGINSTLMNGSLTQISSESLMQTENPIDGLSISHDETIAGISLDDVVDTLASVAAQDGEEFTKPICETVNIELVSNDLTSNNSLNMTTCADVAEMSAGTYNSCIDGDQKKVKETDTQLPSGNQKLFSSISDIATTAVLCPELETPGTVSNAHVLNNFTSINGVANFLNSELGTLSELICNQVSTDTICVSHSSQLQDKSQLSPKVLPDVGIKGNGTNVVISSIGSLSPRHRLLSPSDSVSYCAAISSLPLTTIAVTSAQANVTWATAPVMTVMSNEQSHFICASPKNAESARISPHITNSSTKISVPLSPDFSASKRSPANCKSASPVNSIGNNQFVECAPRAVPDIVVQLQQHLNDNNSDNIAATEISDHNFLLTIPTTTDCTTVENSRKPLISGLSNVGRRSPNCLFALNSDLTVRSTNSSNLCQQDGIDSSNPIMAPGFPLNLTESVQRVMQGIPTDSITPPPSPKPSRSLSSPNTRSCRSSPHLSNANKRLVVSSAPLVNTLGEIRSLVDCSTVVLSNVRPNVNSSTIGKHTGITSIVRQLPKPSVSSHTNFHVNNNNSGVSVFVNSLSSTNCKQSQSINIASSSSAGLSSHCISNVVKSVTNSSPTELSNCLPKPSCADIPLVIEATNSTVSTVTVYSCASVSAMDHNYPAPILGDTNDMTVKNNNVSNCIPLQSNDESSLKYEKLNCHDESGEFNCSSILVEQSESNHIADLLDCHENNVSNAVADVVNNRQDVDNKISEHSEMRLRSRTKKPPAKNNEEDDNPVQISTNGPLNKRRGGTPAADEDHEDALRRGVKRMRRKTECSISETNITDEEISNNNDTEENHGTNSCSETNQMLTNADLSGDLKNSLNSALRRSTRSCKAKQHFEVAVPVSNKRNRSHQTEPS